MTDFVCRLLLVECSCLQFTATENL